LATWICGGLRGVPFGIVNVVGEAGFIRRVDDEELAGWVDDEDLAGCVDDEDLAGRLIDFDLAGRVHERRDSAADVPAFTDRETILPSFNGGRELVTGREVVLPFGRVAHVEESILSRCCSEGV
jgi:hypothetical protein